MTKRLWSMSFVAVAVMCVALLTGCGGINRSPEELIRESIESDLSTINTDNFMEVMNATVSDDLDEMGIDSKEFSEAYLEDFKYAINEVTVDENKGIAEANITITMKSSKVVMSNFQNLLSAWIDNIDASNIPSEDEIMKETGVKLLQAIRATDAEDKNITITYIKGSDGVWEVDGDFSSMLAEAAQ